MNAQDFYCGGGVGDGLALRELLRPMNAQDFYCGGGVGDGQALHDLHRPLNDQGFYCGGGEGDGLALRELLRPMNAQEFYCGGGVGDGLALRELLRPMNTQDFYCGGGSGDGFVHYNSSMLYLGLGIWTGLTNRDWNNQTNWKHSLIPGELSTATIPEDCPNYPVLNTTFSIKSQFGEIKCGRLDVLAGANFTSRHPVEIAGELNINGTYQHIDPDTNTFTVIEPGQVLVKSGGQLKILQ
jgi:hypothetical protein